MHLCSSSTFYSRLTIFVKYKQVTLFAKHGVFRHGSHTVMLMSHRDAAVGFRRRGLRDRFRTSKTYCSLLTIDLQEEYLGGRSMTRHSSSRSRVDLSLARSARATRRLAQRSALFPIFLAAGLGPEQAV